MISPNTILQDRYRIVRQLGRGGMGTVYEALDQRVNCIVAIKETLASNDDDTRHAFEREASLLANLRHPALPKVMDYFVERDGDFLVMEFIPGSDLAELLKLSGSKFSEDQILDWADELLKVLEYLHGQKQPILHRDIKPSNLKITEKGELFLLDFGLAKGSAGQMTVAATSRSVHAYTPVYASLEQILGQGTDPRSDLYSLGATLYHLLTGIPPVDAPTRYHMIEDEHPDPLRPIIDLNPQISSSVIKIISQAMEISRKRRPSSAAEMREALGRSRVGQSSSTASDLFDTGSRNHTSQANNTVSASMSQPILKTLVAPPPERFRPQNQRGSSVIDSSVSKPPPLIPATGTRRVLMVMGLVFIFGAAMLIAFFSRGTANKNSSQPSGDKTLSAQASPGDKLTETGSVQPSPGLGTPMPATNPTNSPTKSPSPTMSAQDIDAAKNKDIPTNRNGDPKAGSSPTSKPPASGGGLEADVKSGGDSSGKGDPESTAVDYSKTFDGKDVTQKARIMSKPEPQYTEQARKNQITGNVVLAVVLSSNGTVTNIRPVRGLPDGLTEKAIEAAREMKFTPATKDGHAVSQFAQVEYNFNLY